MRPRRPGEPEPEIAAIKEELEASQIDLQKLRDPVVQGSLMFRLQQERENSNRMLKTILETLESRFQKLEDKIAKIEEKLPSTMQYALSQAPAYSPSQSLSPSEVLLPSVDEEIVSFIRSKGTACAEDVRVHFRYKGKNAASSRLNHLFELGVLEKKQAGRMVYYRMKN